MEAKAAAHLVHIIAFFVLAATGALLYSPEARSWVTSGHSLVLVRVHWYVGLVSIPVLPAMIIAFIRAARNGKSKGAGWKKLHSMLILLTGICLATTGFPMWFKNGVSENIRSASTWLHGAATVAALCILFIHLVMAKKLGEYER